MTLLGRLRLSVAFVVMAWFLAVAFVVMLAGCGGGELGVTPTSRAVAASACFIKSNPPAGALQPNMRAGGVGGTCRSPEGAWQVTLKNRTGAWTCALYLTRVGNGRRVRVYGSHDAGCYELSWAKPDDLLLFENNSLFYSLNPATRKLTQLASFGEYVVSPNRLWVAGNAVPGPEAPQGSVFALTADNSRCLIVPLGPHRTDEIVGFTRDSKSVIVSSAPWNGTSSPPPGKARMRQFRLSSLHTNCAGQQLVG